MKTEAMDEVTTMMIRSSGNHGNGTFPKPINTSTSPRWKLYDNPFYYSHRQQQQQCPSRKHLHPFWDQLAMFKPVMDSDLDIARAQIIELKEEMEYERKARMKVESMNKKLAKQIGEERREREALERVCEKLAREISWYKSAIVGMKKEVEEERKMLRMAEVLREERVQMKLAEAKILFEEKLMEFKETKSIDTSNLSGKFSRFVFSEKSSSMEIPSPNPHNKPGIKGFVEFPTMVRAMGSKSRHWGTKLEFQKAQLKILLNQKNLIRANSLITS